MTDRERPTFPGTKAEALAWLYTQAQDLTGKTPEEVCAIFDDARQRIFDEIARKAQGKA